MVRPDVRRRLVSAAVALTLAVPVTAALSSTASAAEAPTSGQTATVAARTTTTFDVLQRGDKGRRVSRVQYWLDLPRTGFYGDRTFRAVRHFQSHRSLSDTGRVGARTWQALDTAWTRLAARYQQVLTTARAHFGDPYVYGAAGPHAFDCSGFTMFVYRQAAGIALPHQSGEQYQRATRITRAEARPGDLVFFHSGGSVYHAAIYAGHGYVVHAPSSGRVVQRERIWSSNISYGRVIHRA